MENQKRNKGMTLSSLVVTTIVLLILAGISVAALTGENGLISSALNAKEKNEISNEKEIVEVATVQAMGKNKIGNVTLAGLQDQLDINAGEGITNVTEDIEEKILLAKFIETERIYEVDEDGNVQYLGKESNLLTQATITASPPSNTTPELVQKVELTVKTPLMIEDENISLMYAWNQDEKQSPEMESYTEETLLGTLRTRKAIVASNDTEAGNYYLWAKVLIGDNEITQVFGPYTIKDHTTLVATKTETSATSGFLGNTSLERNIIESVTISTSFNGHNLSDENCWDVSQSQDGRYIAWYEDADSDGHPEVTIAGNGGVVANSNSSYLFANIGSEIEETTQINGIENLDTGLVTNMSSMFFNCKNLTNLDASNFDTGNVIYMSSLFRACSSLTILDVSKFDTSNVTDMRFMFAACNSLIILNLNSFDTSNVTDMTSMFTDCYNLDDLDISNFDTIRVTYMVGMFSSCSSLTSLNLSNFDTSNVTNMVRMFYNCKNLTNLNISSFNTSNVTNMDAMFSRCYSLTTLNLNSFDTSNVISMSNLYGGMFKDCYNLTTLDLSNFNTINVTNMSQLFYNCNKLIELKIDNFNMTNVTSYEDMLYNVPKTVTIKTNADTKTWIEENISDYKDCITII